MEISNQVGNKLLYKDECYAIQGAIFDVYKEVGCGFLESIYHECLSREFRRKEIPFLTQPELPVFYKGELLPLRFQSDFFCFENIIVEIKAKKELVADHRAQIQNYLRISKLRLGLLVNFGHYPRVEIERTIH